MHQNALTELEKSSSQALNSNRVALQILVCLGQNVRVIGLASKITAERAFLLRYCFHQVKAGGTRPLAATMQLKTTDSHR